MSNKTQKIALIAVGIIGSLIGVIIILSVNISAGRSKLPGREKLSPSKEAMSLQNSFISVADLVSPAVVNISTEQILKYRYYGYDYDDFFDRFFDSPYRRPKERYYKRQGLGTGMIVSEYGFILTNQHVVSEVNKITVVLADKSEYEASVVAFDKSHDLALIKIYPENKLPKVLLADSEKIKVGEWAIAIGNPFGYDHTVTAGIVSAKGRLYQSSDENGVKAMPNLIQTDAAINPGNSGGPLVNISGEVIGINTFIVSTSGSYAGIGFAVPVNDAKELLKKIKGTEKKIAVLKKENVAYFGMKVAKLDETMVKKYGLAVKEGVLIISVAEGSEADTAGLAAGDVIIEIDKKQVKTPEDYEKFIKASDVKEGVLLVVNRRGVIYFVVITGKE
ncbi:MAG: trypsin-like peptidase domain-containing protein [Candidatus Firestonebacteria bacterium]